MTRAGDDGLIPIGRFRAWGLMILGPANSWDNPLVGTRYDPMVRRRLEQERRAARATRRARHRR